MKFRLARRTSFAAPVGLGAALLVAIFCALITSDNVSARELSQECIKLGQDDSCPQPRPAPAPRDLSATASTLTSVSLTWSAVSGASLYRLERRRGTSGAWTPVSSSISRVSHTATGLSRCTTYYFRVSAKGDGLSYSLDFGSVSGSISRKTMCPTAPAPSGLMVTASNQNSVSLRWNAVSNASRYKLEWRKGNSGGWSANSYITSTSHAVTRLSPCTTYNFKISARGDGSPYSTSFGLTASVSGKTACPPAPAPSGLTVTASNQNSVSLKWNAVSNASRYKLERRRGRSGSWVPVSSDISGVSHTASGLSRCATYYFKVSAKGDDSTYSISFGSASASVSGKTACPPAPAPSNFRVSSSTKTSVSLRWNAVTNAYRYKLERRKTAGLWTLVSSTISGSSSSYLVSGLACNTTYYFRISSRGDGSPYSIAFGSPTSLSKRTKACIETPTLAPVPGNFRVTSSTPTSVSLRWNAVSNASRYKLEWRRGNSGGWSANSNIISTSRAVTGLSPCTAYNFKISASGDGSPYSTSFGSTASVSGTTECVAPAPGNFRASNSTRTGVSLRWNSVRNADKYKLQWRKGSTDWTTESSSISGTAYTVSDLTCNVSYSFRVSANGDGSPYSTTFGPVASASGKTAKCPNADAPDDLEVSSYTRTSVSLSWDAVANADKYRPERRAEGGDWIIASSKVTGTSYTVSGLTCNISYSFRVRAKGDGSPLSDDFGDASDAVSQKTSKCPKADAPGNLRATASDRTSVTLRWDAVTDAHRYKLEISSTGRDNSWMSVSDGIAVAGGKATGLVCNATHYFRVSAKGDGSPLSNEFGDASGAVSRKTSTCPDAAAPSNLRATAFDRTSVTLRWDAVLDAHAYKLERRESSSSDWTEVSSTISGTTRKAAGLTCGATYYFRVSAKGDGSPLSKNFGSPSTDASQKTADCLHEFTPNPVALGGRSGVWTVPAGVSRVYLDVDFSKMSELDSGSGRINIQQVDAAGNARSTLFVNDENDSAPFIRSGAAGKRIRVEVDKDAFDGDGAVVTLTFHSGRNSSGLELARAKVQTEAKPSAPVKSATNPPLTLTTGGGRVTLKWLPGAKATGSKPDHYEVVIPGLSTTARYSNSNVPEGASATAIVEHVIYYARSKTLTGTHTAQVRHCNAVGGCSDALGIRFTLPFPSLSAPTLDANGTTMSADVIFPGATYLYYWVNLLWSSSGVTYSEERSERLGMARTRNWTVQRALTSSRNGGYFKFEARICTDDNKTRSQCKSVKSAALAKLVAPSDLDVSPMALRKAKLTWTASSNADPNTEYAVQIVPESTPTSWPQLLSLPKVSDLSAGHVIDLDAVVNSKGFADEGYFKIRIVAQDKTDAKVASEPSVAIKIIDNPILTGGSADGKSIWGTPRAYLKWDRIANVREYTVRYRELGDRPRRPGVGGGASRLPLDHSSVNWPNYKGWPSRVEWPYYGPVRKTGSFTRTNKTITTGLVMGEIHAFQLNYTTTSGEKVFSARDAYTWISDDFPANANRVATYTFFGHHPDRTYRYKICPSDFPMSDRQMWFDMIDHAFEQWEEASDGLVEVVRDLRMSYSCVTNPTNFDLYVLTDDARSEVRMIDLNRNNMNVWALPEIKSDIFKGFCLSAAPACVTSFLGYGGSLSRVYLRLLDDGDPSNDGNAALAAFLSALGHRREARNELKGVDVSFKESHFYPGTTKRPVIPSNGVKFNTCRPNSNSANLIRINPDIGYYAYETALHEAGHALGLSNVGYALNTITQPYHAAHPTIPDSAMNYDDLRDDNDTIWRRKEKIRHPASGAQSPGIVEPDCSPHPFDIMAVRSLYGFVPKVTVLGQASVTSSVPTRFAASVDSGKPPYTYNWIAPENFSILSGKNGATVLITPPRVVRRTPLTIEVVVKDKQGLTARGQIEILVNP